MGRRPLTESGSISPAVIACLALSFVAFILFAIVVGLDLFSKRRGTLPVTEENPNSRPANR
jgi:hypothetical protein